MQISENLVELNSMELIEISGGSEASYNAGYNLGQDVRRALDNVGLVTLIVLLATRGRVRL